MQQLLTKQNFWDALEEKFPLAIAEFKTWIDEYKKKVNWDGLFKVVADTHEGYPAEMYKQVKYHELPDAMQVGIWLQFCSEQPEKTRDIAIDNFDLRADMEGFFEWINAGRPD